MKIETYCPLFPGFYGTIFEPQEENDIDWHNEENGTDLSYDDFDFDYEDYQNRVASTFTESFEKHFSEIMPIKVKFQKVVSPKFYNFSNDQINIEVELDFSKFMEIVRENKNIIREYIRNNYTSRDGFTSWHSNNIEDWCDEEYILENPSHRVGALMEAILSVDDCDISYWAESEMFYINYSVKNENGNNNQ